MKRKKVVQRLAVMLGEDPDLQHKRTLRAAIGLIRGEYKPDIDWKVDCGGVWYRTETKKEAENIAARLGYPGAVPERIT